MLVIGGAMDIVTKPEASRTIAEKRARRPASPIVEDVNHMGFLERYDTYNDEIVRLRERGAKRPCRERKRKAAAAPV